VPLGVIKADWLIAAGTIGLAAFTAWLAWGTHRLAVSATTDQRAHWRPVLIAPQEEAAYGDGELSLAVKNVGNGPAFGVRGEFNLAGGGSATLPNLPNVCLVDEFLHLQFTKVEIPGGRAISVRVTYYDLAEWFHVTHFTILTPPKADKFPVYRVGQTFVGETGRRLLPVHGSPRARAEAERRASQLWRRALRRIRHPRGGKS
jgi:hypothetical protein